LIVLDFANWVEHCSAVVDGKGSMIGTFIEIFVKKAKVKVSKVKQSTAIQNYPDDLSSSYCYCQ
jgi:hypothetical protein